MLIHALFRLLLALGLTLAGLMDHDGAVWVEGFTLPGNTVSVRWGADLFNNNMTWTNIPLREDGQFRWQTPPGVGMSLDHLVIKVVDKDWAINETVQEVPVGSPIYPTEPVAISTPIPSGTVNDPTVEEESEDILASMTGSCGTRGYITDAMRPEVMLYDGDRELHNSANQAQAQPSGDPDFPNFEGMGGGSELKREVSGDHPQGELRVVGLRVVNKQGKEKRDWHFVTGHRPVPLKKSIRGQKGFEKAGELAWRL